MKKRLCEFCKAWGTPMCPWCPPGDAQWDQVAFDWGFCARKNGVLVSQNPYAVTNNTHAAESWAAGWGEQDRVEVHES